MTMAQKRERILPRLIEEEMRDSFLDYSMSVIVQRALPDVRDGLKPVHRRILYAMHGLGLLPDRPYKKSASVVGEVLGKYHPHGDVAVYDALVRMVQDFSLRYPLVDGQGNFGSIDGDSAAAYRYTEARLASVAVELLEDLDKDTADFVPNFDDRLREPSVLPGRIPNLLVNGSSGIAVGMSTNVPPHNLREVASALHLLAEKPECTVEELVERVPGPDFPTGGYIVGDEGIRDMYATGRGRIVMRARVVKEALRGGKEQLVVTELPYAVSKSRVIEQIVAVSRKGGLDEVSDVRDESDRDGMRLVLELKRGADVGAVLQTLFRKTYLQSTFGAILLALDRGEPHEFDLKGLLEEYRDHRIEVIQRRSRHDLEKAEAERHIVEGLLAALDAIDEVIRIIRASDDREEASATLQDRLGLSQPQADAILNMRLARLTALEGVELRRRRDELAATIEELRTLLGSEARQLEVVLQELDEVVEKFGDERRTEILADAEEHGSVVEGQVADEEVVITVSHEGFVKRIPMHLYRRRTSSGKALAGMEGYDDDFLERVFVARTTGWLLAFTAGGHTHFLSVLDVPEGSRASRGQSCYALLGADRSDRIVALLPVDDLEAERYLIFVSESGIMKRTRLTEFSNPRAGGVIGAGVRGEDRILDVALSDGSSEVMLLTRRGRAIRFPEEEVSIMGRTARGVKGVDLRDDDRVVGMISVRREASILSVTERGKGKRTDLSEFPLQKRGGLGTLAAPAGAEEDPVIGALEVFGEEEVMIVTAGGKVHRLPVAEVPSQGRRTRGVRLITLEKEDRVVEVTSGIEETSKKSDPARSREGAEEPAEGAAAEAPGETEGAAVEASADPEGESDGEGQLELIPDEG